jgi:uncharacterized protein YukJ
MATMPLSDYGVLAARAIDSQREGQAQTPHFQVRLVDDDRTSYRIAVNVRSQQSPPDLLYLVDDDLRHPVTAMLSGLASGWHALAPGPGGPNLDFIRANLFDRAAMRVLPSDVAGPDNDLADLLDHYAQRAIGDAAAGVYAFGQRWGPEQGKPDKVFGFEPGDGVHDIHMNQGSSGEFRRDNGVWQDGGLIMHFPSENRWVGIFLAFQSQAWHTDDTTGDPLDDGGGGDETAAVAIIAAMVNPTGPAPEAETVLLLNASPAPVDLSGWRIADRAKTTCAVPGGALAPGATLQVPVSDGVALGNNGGAITLLDGAGLKIDGVAYTADDAQREGWTVVF